MMSVRGWMAAWAVAGIVGAAGLTAAQPGAGGAGGAGGPRAATKVSADAREAGRGGDPLLPPANSPRRAESDWAVIVGANVVTGAGSVGADGKLSSRLGHIVIRGGRIEEVVLAAEGAKEAPALPASAGGERGATRWDGTGWYVYPGLVEPWLEVETPAVNRDDPGVHWNRLVMPQRKAGETRVAARDAKALRELGFVAAGVVPKGGIFKGEGAAVSLAEVDGDASVERPAVYRAGVFQAVSITTASERGEAEGGTVRWDGYPNSQMGSIALIRQTLLDAQWEAGRRAAGEAVGPSALEGLGGGAGGAGGAGNAGPALWWDVTDELEGLRALRMAREFGRGGVLVGSGTEFRRLEALAELARAGDPAGTAVVVPLAFPKKPAVASLGEAEAVDLRELMTWEQAPTNPRRLVERGLTVAITSSKTRERGQFLTHLRSAVKHGLKEGEALKMVTATPARLLGLGDELGAIEAGKRASLVVLDGPMFASKSKIKEVWIDGQRHELSPRPADLMGTWAVEVTPAEIGAVGITLQIGKDLAVTVKKEPEAEKAAAPEPVPAEKAAAPEGDGRAGKPAPPEAEGRAGKPAPPKSSRAKNVKTGEGKIAFTFEHKPFSEAGVVTMAGAVTGETMTGVGVLPDGTAFAWTAKRTDKSEPKPAAGEKPARGEKGDKDNKADAGEAKEKPEAEKPADAVVGEWSLVLKSATLPGGEVPFTLAVTRSGEGYDGSIVSAFGSPAVKELSFDAATGTLTLVAVGPDGQAARLVATVKDGALEGSGTALGQNATVSGTKRAAGASGEGEDDKPVTDVPAELPGYPFGAYAVKTMPASEHVVIRGGTVWTSAAAGRIEDGEVEFKDGVLVYVGKKRAAAVPGARVIDATGQHVTPGLIDCHSHTGISGGVNESGQAVTSEVRIQDVTNPDAINWYRQLAGGITMVSNLHGSANPIGGQQAVNKPRWGAADPAAFHFAGEKTYSDANPFEDYRGGADERGTLEKPVTLKPGASGVLPGIKFALGENVKQSNWGERSTWRYPQTRMGVEAILRDRFNAASDYLGAWARWNDGGKRGVPPRRDLELEALAEVLTGRRLVHCHSYRQDEILMLARLSREFGFRLGTYQHILEGYKVADAVRDSALGASGFSDWWNFKVEVQDAIPQGGPIMHEVGVVVSYNSDSDELARRMNVEAAKAHKYSRRADGTYSVSEEEALKFVTINPAIQLGLEKKTGSLEVGKQADVAVWSGSPLSTFSRAASTWIEGACVFSLEQDAALRKQNAAERTRLIQKLLKDGAGSGDAPRGEGENRRGTDTPPRRRPTGEELRSGGLIGRMLDQSEEARRALYMDLVRRGARPEDARRGVCGCDEW